MSPLALSVAMGAAASWAALDALRKRLAEEVKPVPLVVLLSVAPALGFVAWAVAVDARWSLDLAYLGWAAASVVSNLVAYVAFVSALTVSPLSTTIPLLSLTPVVATLMAVVFHGETPSPRQAVGIAIVVVAALVLQTRAKGEGTLLGMLRSFWSDRGARLMLVVAVAWSVAPNLDKRALAFASEPAHAAVQSGGVGLCLLLWLQWRGRGAELLAVRQVPGVFAVAFVLSLAALGMQLSALRLDLVGLVETIKRAVGLIASLAVGRIFFGESVTRAQWLAALVLVFGTTLLAG